MRVAYEASSIRRQLSGVGHYTASLLNALRGQFPDQQWLILSHLPRFVEPGSNVLRTQARSFPIKEIWMQLWVPRIVLRYRPDICHYTNGIAPLYSGAPYVVTVHDLSLVRHPEWHPAGRRLWMGRILRPSISRAAGVLCDSEATRKDLLSWMELDESRVWVVPLAARSSFLIARSHNDRENVKARYGLRRPFLLYVGNIEPRKNLARLLLAFRSADIPEVDLVLAGRCAWLYEGVLSEAAHLKNTGRVRFLNYVHEDDLPALFQSALAFVYPSLMEGFGLPVLEAMVSETPVVVSRVEPLVSLVGDAGWLADPERVEDWRTALSEVVFAVDKRKALAGAAKLRAKEYHWDRAARETMKCYESALSAAGPVGFTQWPRGRFP